MKLHAVMGALLLGWALHGQAATSTYVFQVLRGFENHGSYSDAVDVNDAGMVVGTSYMEFARNPRAALWIDGRFTDLGTLGGDGSQAHAINSSGVIVGQSEMADGSTHATQWSAGQIKELAAPSGDYGIAYGINDLGVVVGRSGAPGGSSHAVVWTDGVLQELHSANSAAYSINNAGTIVGESDVFMRGNHATKWQGGVATVLDFPVEEHYSAANALNEQGMIAGTYRTGSFYGYRGFLVNQEGVRTAVPDSEYSSVEDINSRGWAVGSSFFPGAASAGATVWIDGVAIDLNTWMDSSVKQAGWELQGARGINDNNWIVGQAENKFTGERAGFLITPVPEPASYALMLAGLGLIGAISRKRSGRREDRP